MTVKWTTYATNDLLSIQEHISRDSLQYALIVVDRILERTEQLESFPESGSVVPEFGRSDVREVFVYSYRIIHQLYDNEVHILTVCHGAKPLATTLTGIR